MGVASMVIGIVALLFGFIPFCGTWAILPAGVGVGLGIADLVAKSKRKKGRGMAIAGLVLNPLAILVIVGWWMLLAANATNAVKSFDPSFQQQVMQNLQQLQQQQQGNVPPAQSGTPAPVQSTPDMKPMKPVDEPAPSKPSTATDTATPPARGKAPSTTPPSGAPPPASSSKKPVGL